MPKSTLADFHAELDRVKTERALEFKIDNCAYIKNLDELASLSWLDSVIITSCEELADLNGLSNLYKLRILKINGCYRITSLAPIAKLNLLEQLDISLCYKIENLNALSTLSNLKVLSLLGCFAISDATPLANVKKLEFLDWVGCQSVVTLDSLEALTSLRKMRLLVVPKGAGINSLLAPPGVDFPAPILARFPEGLLKCPVLELITNKFEDVPREIQSLGRFENCMPRIRAWAQDKEGGVIKEHGLKLYILGNGNVGKTQIRRFFLSENFDPSIPSTHGIELRILPKGSPPLVVDAQIQFWDFGGQEIFHGTHSLFIERNAIYIVAWNSELELAAGVVSKDCRPVSYWIDFVKSLAGGVDILFVQTKCDERSDEMESPPLILNRVPKARLIAFSSKTKRGAPMLIGGVQEAVRDYIHAHPPLWIGRGWAAVRDKILMQRISERLETMSMDAFKALCVSEGTIVSHMVLLHYLHASGVVFYDKELFGAQIIITPDKALDAIYLLFDRNGILNALSNQGTFTLQELNKLKWGGKTNHFSIADQRVLVSMMEACGLCFPLRRLRSGQQVWLAPDLTAPCNPAKDRIKARLKEGGDPCLSFTYSYDFLHEGIVRRVIVEIGRAAGDAAAYWKGGMWFHDQSSGADAIIEAAEKPSIQNPSGGIIEVTVFGHNGHQLKNIFDRVVLSVSSPSGTVDGLYKHTDEEFTRVPMHLSKLKIQAPLTPPGKARRLVYISYAWGDESDDGTKREAVVKRLDSCLQQAGFNVVMDKQTLIYGESLGEFIKSFSLADRAVVVITEKYLKSINCIKELFALWNRSGYNTKSLSELVHPIILDDANISSTSARSNWALYWKRERELLEAKLGKLKITSLSSSDIENLRQLEDCETNLTDILSALNDVYLPRGFNDVMADDFKAIIKLLK